MPIVDFAAPIVERMRVMPTIRGISGTRNLGADLGQILREPALKHFVQGGTPIALDLSARFVVQPVHWIRWQIVWPQLGDLARKSNADPGQPVRSASTEGGIAGDSANNALTCCANASKDDPAGGRSYLGARPAANARFTILREAPT